MSDDSRSSQDDTGSENSRSSASAPSSSGPHCVSTMTESSTDYSSSRQIHQSPSEKSSNSSVGYVVQWIGSIGIYLAVFGVVLAVTGLGLSLLQWWDLARILFAFSLFFVTIAMIAGVLFQTVRPDNSDS